MNNNIIITAFMEGFTGGVQKVASDDASIEKLAVFSQIFFDSLSTELEKIQKARGK
jgi:hypothetical protein